MLPTHKVKATYVTPKNAGMAVMNAMAEIRAREAYANQLLSDTEQIQTILYHLRDFFGGRVLVMQFRNLLSLRTLIDLICADPDSTNEVGHIVDEKRGAA